MNRLIGSAAKDVQAVLDVATAACARRRGELEVDAIVRFHADAIDVFLGADPNPSRARSLIDRPSGDLARPTEMQRAALERAGVTLSRLPRASLHATRRRCSDGSRSVGPWAVLTGAGQATRPREVPTVKLTFARARELCTILGDAGWRPLALYGTPEYEAARAVRAGRPETA